MDALLEPLARSPQLPKLVEELTDLLQSEAERRQRFYDDSDERKMEFINGEVVVQSPAKVRHLAATTRLITLLKAHVTANDLGAVFAEKALVCFTRNDYEPDLVFFAKAKAAELRPEQMKLPVPDFIVEVLSPTTEAIDRGLKHDDYAAHGVQEYWIIDTEAEIVEQYLLDSAGQYQLHARKDDGQLRSEVITGFAIPVRAIFDDQEHLRTLRAMLA
jgi:Uma2 family endonuclease